MKKREKFHDFISKVELLDSLTSMEKDKICDCLKTRQYRPGEKVLSEGDDGDCFYILISGKCIATKQDKEKGTEKTVYEFGENDYFGELALLKNEPRAASIVAVNDIEVAFIDRAAFKRLLGPLDEILKRNAHRYEKYIESKN